MSAVRTVKLSLTHQMQISGPRCPYKAEISRCLLSTSFHFLLALEERKEIARVDIRYLLLRTKQKRHLLIKYLNLVHVLEHCNSLIS